MKTKSIWVIALWAAGLGTGSVSVGCKKEALPSAADKAAEQRAAADRVAADKAAALKEASGKAAADKAAALKEASDKAAADKAAALKEAAEQSAAEKAVAEKAAADKAAVEKAAAEKAATQAMAEASSLPTDLVETKAEILRTMAQIDVTMAKLEALSASTGDLDKPSEGALGAIQTLEAEMQALKQRGDDMRNRGAAYFEVWEKQLAAMSTPEVVAIATKRKDEFSARYAEVLTTMQESRAALDAYWADMKAIREAVDDGLTPETLKLLGPQIKAAKEKATTLKSRAEATSKKLNQVSALYTKP